MPLFPTLFILHLEVSYEAWPCLCFCRATTPEQTVLGVNIMSWGSQSDLIYGTLHNLAGAQRTYTQSSSLKCKHLHKHRDPHTHIPGHRHTHSHTADMWGNSKSPYICRLKTKTRSVCTAKWGGVLTLTFYRCLSHFSWKKKTGFHQSALDDETTEQCGGRSRPWPLHLKRIGLALFLQWILCRSKTTTPAFYLYSIWMLGTSSSSLCPRCKTKPTHIFY